MLDLLVTDATLPDGREHMSIAVQDGRIVEVTPGLAAPAHETITAGGLPTLRLIRTTIGPYGLDGLAPGAWREVEVRR